VTKNSKQELLSALRPQYLKAHKAEKGLILDQFVAATGYHRKYAIHLFENGLPRPSRRSRKGQVRYGPDVVWALTKVWEACGGICALRLKPFLPEMIEVLERTAELALEPEVKELLLQMSVATINRKLKPARRQLKRPRLNTTKPGSLLKNQIPIRTFADWNDARPGFTEMDLVAHCGHTTSGEYVISLSVVDIATGWWEGRACTYRSQVRVFAALETIRQRLPFSLLGLDSDNDAAFINDHLRRYCQREEITFTRCRPYKKNDQAHIEQKNWSVIRRLVGYDRLEGEETTAALNAVYEVLRLWNNFFQPSVKLVEKHREGAKVRKKYDQAKTPYQRVLESPDVAEADKEALHQLYLTLNPITLRRQLDGCLEVVWKLGLG
jgi:hypothetical protein